MTAGTPAALHTHHSRPVTVSPSRTRRGEPAKVQLERPHAIPFSKTETKPVKSLCRALKGGKTLSDDPAESGRPDEGRQSTRAPPPRQERWGPEPSNPSGAPAPCNRTVAKRRPTRRRWVPGERRRRASRTTSPSRRTAP